MQNELPTFIKVIMSSCNVLEDKISNFCAGRSCFGCDFNKGERNCYYKTNLLMLLNGYRMATTEPTEKAQIDAFLKDNYPTFITDEI